MWWEAAKWVAAICWLLATALLLSPKIAAESLVPWILFLVGNLIWVADNIRLRNIQWTIPGGMFVILDVALIWTRYSHEDITTYIQPILTIMEKWL